jgi:hypothetical protein
LDRVQAGPFDLKGDRIMGFALRSYSMKCFSKLFSALTVVVLLASPAAKSTLKVLMVNRK